jgi:tetratricopeptide (TPR) repeat protein
MLIGNARFNAGELAGAIEALEEARALLERFGNTADAALATANLARAHARSGDFGPAHDAGRRAAELADESGDPNVVLDVRIFRGIVAGEQGALDEAERLTAEGVALADEVGNTYCSLVGNFYLGDQRLRQGRPEDAIAALERSQDLAEFCDAGSMLSLSGAWLSSARARRGDDTVASFAGPIARAHASGDRYAEALVLQLRAGARRAQADPDSNGAIEDLEAAAGLLEELGARPALARVLTDLAAALRLTDRQDEAREVGRRAEELAGTTGLVMERHDAR